MVISQFYPIVAGAEKQALLLSKTLKARGHRIRVVTGWWLRGTARHEVIEQIPVVRNFSVWGISGPRWARPLAAFVYMVTLFSYLLRYRKDYDIIHVHQALYPAFVAVLVSKLVNKPIVVKVGCSGEWGDVKAMTEGKIPLGPWMLRLIRHCDRIVATNRAMRKELENVGFLPERITHIPNGVVPENRKHDHAQESPNVTTLVYVGRLGEQKGVEVLFDAIKRPHRKNVRLSILGDGPERSSLKKKSQQLGLQDQVAFCGHVSDVWPHLVRADIFVLPSRSEGMSNALLEAMSAGLPCIVTHIPGNSDLVHGDTDTPAPPQGGFKIGRHGITVGVDDPEALAVAIDALEEDVRLRERLGRGAEQAIGARYAVDSIADQYIDLYASLYPHRRLSVSTSEQ